MTRRNILCNTISIDASVGVSMATVVRDQYISCALCSQ